MKAYSVLVLCQILKIELKIESCLVGRVEKNQTMLSQPDAQMLYLDPGALAGEAPA